MARVGGDARHGGMIVPKCGMRVSRTREFRRKNSRAAVAVVGAGNSGIPAVHCVAVDHGVANVVLADAGLRRRRTLRRVGRRAQQTWTNH